MCGWFSNRIAQERFFPLTSSQPLCRDPVYTMAPAAAPAPTVLRELSVPRVLSVPPRPPRPPPEQPAPEPREQPSASHHLVVRTLPSVVCTGLRMYPSAEECLRGTKAFASVCLCR